MVVTSLQLQLILVEKIRRNWKIKESKLLDAMSQRLGIWIFTESKSGAEFFDAKGPDFTVHSGKQIPGKDEDINKLIDEVEDHLGGI